ncbi:MAG: NAD(P)/FAD-dependent oxidoreductase [Pseudomonadota bacterium]
MSALETDYVVIGSGAVGIAFIDTMLDESDADFIIVDKHHMPGGHWNDAYSFVRLHQPSAFYGISSMPLGSDRIDEAGSNKGCYELATASEVVAYFDKVMRERLLPSGRVQYYPMSEYTENGKIKSLLSGEVIDVSVRKRVVDGTFFATSVPSTHTRKFAVDDGVTCVPPNDLPTLAAKFGHYVVLGGGKTAMDSVVWLIDHGASPDTVTWICPRASWLINRRITQPGREFFEDSIGGAADQFEALAEATNTKNLFHRLEAADVMLRIDPDVEPEMFHYATIAQGEVDQMRRVKNTVRGERVAHIGKDAMVMKSGKSIPMADNALYIDCTATAVDFVTKRDLPVFEPGRITLQPVFAPLASYSAAVVAYVEANYDDDAQKNTFCKAVPLPDTPGEWPASVFGNLMNQNAWNQDKALRDWTQACRLNPTAAAVNDPAPLTDGQAAIAKRVRNAVLPAAMNIQKLIAAKTEAA